MLSVSTIPIHVGFDIGPTGLHGLRIPRVTARDLPYAEVLDLDEIEEEVPA